MCMFFLCAHSNNNSIGMQTLLPFKNDGRTSNPVIHDIRIKKGLVDEVQMETDITLYSPSTGIYFI
jgi:hypothetical protein